MTLYNEPRDTIAHLHQLEVNLGFAGYDHFGPQVKGWRAEKQSADMASRDSDRQQAFTQNSSAFQRLVRWFMQSQGVKPVN